MTITKFIKYKSTIDFILGIIMLIAVLPAIFLISIILALILKSFPVIVQKRGITKENKIFNIYKFKTIRNNSYIQINSENILFKPDLSQYVPAFCKWLRKTGLDELTQLINVLKGEMSLVGPRPLTISDLEILEKNYPKAYFLRNQIKVKPGITGMWQIYGDRNKGIDNLIYYDLYYCKLKSLSADFRILIDTFIIILKGKHSDSIISCMENINLLKASHNSQKSIDYNISSLLQKKEFNNQIL